MSLPQRDEDWLREITAGIERNPMRDVPDDDSDGYQPETVTKVKMVPRQLYEDTITDLQVENAEIEGECRRLATERDELQRQNGRLTSINRDLGTIYAKAEAARKEAIEDAGKITDLYNHQRNINTDLASKYRTLERRVFLTRLALAGALLVPTVLRLIGR